MKKVVRVATRGSALAQTQTAQVVSLLRLRNPECDFETVIFKTTGDRVTDRPLSSFRGAGVFVKELQNALLSGDADLAVHSLKDMPVEPGDGLVVAGFPARNDPHDLFLAAGNATLETIGSGVLVGTSSPRRMVQLRHVRNDLRFADLRGNLDTRLRKLEEGQYDAIVVAAAGMNRLGRQFGAISVLSTSVCLPAAGQGILALECRAGDSDVKSVAATINDHATTVVALCEREFLRVIGGGCSMPIAAMAQVADDTLSITGMIADPQTGRLVRGAHSTKENAGATAAKVLAEQLLEMCSREGIVVK